MLDDIFKTYLLSDLQVGILLNLLGFEKIYGINIFDENQKINKQNVYEELQHLIEAGILIPKDNALCVDSEVKKILSIVGSSDKILRLTISYEKNKEYMCYLQKKEVAIISDYKKRLNSYGLSLMNRKMFEEEFIVEELLDAKDYFDSCNATQRINGSIVNVNKKHNSVNDEEVIRYGENSKSIDDEYIYDYVPIEDGNGYENDYSEEADYDLKYEKNITESDVMIGMCNLGIVDWPVGAYVQIIEGFEVVKKICLFQKENGFVAVQYEDDNKVAEGKGIEAFIDMLRNGDIV